MPSGQDRHITNRALLLLPLAALLAILPLLIHGCSCGHDLVFHVQSWLDAAQQLRHGHYPRWAFSPAWNAGEPRFLFYPPLSWLLGALLITIFPTAAAPTIYIWIALTAAGLSMYRLANHFTCTLAPNAGRNAALLASTLYVANPYMLFNAFERSALAELLAAAWIPLLLLAVLRQRPTLRGVAIPVALLWLTNAPAAVMGCYTLAFLATLRLLAALAQNLSSRPEAASFAAAVERPAVSLRVAFIFIGGTALGLALPAFYLIPAAFERRYVQVAMAIIPNLRFQDNFLFTRTAYEPHNVVTHTISVLAVVLIVLTATVLSALLLVKDTHKPVISTEAGVPAERTCSVGWDVSRLHRETLSRDLQPAASPATPLVLLTLVLAFLLVPLSTPIWNHLPELAFLQFPWRLLTILAAVLALALALLFANLTHRTDTSPGAPFMARPHRDMSGVPSGRSSPTGVVSGPATMLATLLCPLALGFLCFHLYGQACAPTDHPSAVTALFRTHHGAAPTDEYTPTAADNDTLRSDDPGYWLAPDPQAFAPATIPNPNATNPDYDASTPIDQTVSAPAPMHLTLNLPRPEDLILNLRDYPDWQLTDSTSNQPATIPPHIQRDDGLIAIALPAGPSTVSLRWRDTLDQTLGLALSACALLALALSFRRPRVKSNPDP